MAKEFAMAHPAQTRIMQIGSGWYWEVVTRDRYVIARGMANTHAQARADAEKAASQIQPAAQCWATRAASVGEDHHA
jgi:hypothetical protein